MVSGNGSYSIQVPDERKLFVQQKLEEHKCIKGIILFADNQLI
jgi:hypothetical protein